MFCVADFKGDSMVEHPDKISSLNLSGNSSNGLTVETVEILAEHFARHKFHMV